MLTKFSDEFEEECTGADVASNLTEAKATGTKAKSARAALRKLSKELSQNKTGEVEEYVPMPPVRNFSMSHAIQRVSIDFIPEQLYFSITYLMTRPSR